MRVIGTSSQTGPINRFDWYLITIFHLLQQLNFLLVNFEVVPSAY